MEDVVDPEVLSADRIPVLIYGAGERYQRTVNEEGDVDRALMLYLSDGGVLVVASHQPFPFFYDADGTAVNNAQALGLPVTMGWETPPEAEDLHFEVNAEALEGLPERVTFPDSGDVRWRPADGLLLAEGDLYLPLASLTDASGEAYGEGIAWIERRESEPVGGRLLYCWMRMPDILPPGDLYFALLRMVGEEMAE